MVQNDNNGNRSQSKDLGVYIKAEIEQEAWIQWILSYLLMISLEL